ncbi:MAG: metallophosphoesterase family protein [Chloroflexi bacterium]|nr:metallophosphoesterase family protein [Chloroflexota bacterium]
MRIAVLSDIHANLAALEAVIGDLPPVEETWVLGDIVGYGPQPREVIETLQEIGARSVMGNHDGAAIGLVQSRYFNPDARTAIEWTAEALDANARSYLASLPEVRVDEPLTAVHGSPRDPMWEYITGPDVAEANIGAFETRLCLFGHTHQPVIFHDIDGEIETTPGRPGSRAPIDAATRVLVNPGSVGQPRDGNPDAAYAIVDVDRSGQALVEFRRVTYDIARTQRLMQEAGLPPRLAERLLHGR